MPITGINAAHAFEFSTSDWARFDWAYTCVRTHTHASLYTEFVIRSHNKLTVSCEDTGLGLIRSGLHFWLSLGDLFLSSM